MAQSNAKNAVEDHIDDTAEELTTVRPTSGLNWIANGVYLYLLKTAELRKKKNKTEIHCFSVITLLI